MNLQAELLINAALIVMLTTTALAIARLRSLFAVAMLGGMYSLISACLFVQMDAVDVAFTEAAVGAGITTVLFLGAFALTSSRGSDTSRRHSLLGLIPTLLVGALLIYASLDMPWYGTADTPVHAHPLTTEYLVNSRSSIGVPNVVTSVLASYRGYDTLGEVTVIFTAGLAVVMLLWTRRKKEEPEG